jgi:hypothetical protein
VRFELFCFIVFNSIAAFCKSIFTVHIPAVDQGLGGRISYVFRYLFAIITLEGPRLMLLSRYHAARMEKGKKVGLSAAGGTAIAAIAITTFLIGSQLIAVSIDGKLIGYVETEEQYASLIQQAKEKVSERVGTDTNEILIEDYNVSLETVIAPQQQPLVAVSSEGEGNGTLAGGVTVTEQEGSLIDSLIENLTGAQAIKAQFYTISINDEVFATLATLKEASYVLTSIQESYTPLGGDYTGRFLDKVEIITNVTTDLNEVNTQDPEEVIALLLSGTAEEIVYITVEEDTADNISRALGIGRQDLERAYPDYDFEEVAAGDRFTSTHTIPFIRYEAQGTEIANEPIPFETIEEKTEELFLGQKEIQQEGELGERMVTRLVTLVNGKIIAQTDVGSELVKEPKNEVMLSGTKMVYMGTEAYVGPSDGTGGGGNGALGRPLDSWFLSRSVSAYHNGADMLASQGTPIYAAESGTVTFSGYSGGYGNLVVVDHGNGLQTYYAHCDTLNVTAGDGVGRGQQIATVGSTGRSTAYHLHFEVRVNGAVQEPLNWIG